MTNEEAKNALFHRTPVMYDGCVYTHIKNIIYWLDDSNVFHISLTLADKNKNSSTQARVEDVTLYDYKNQIPTVLS